MSITHIYGEVRALIHTLAPSPQAFGKLCALADEAWKLDEARTSGELIPFMDHALKAWPIGTRRSPVFWEKRLRTQHDKPYDPLSLNRSIFIDYRWTRAQIIGLGNSALAETIQHLYIGYDEDLQANVSAFAQSTKFTNLLSLEIHNGRIYRGTSIWLTELPAWIHASQLKTLKIYGYHTGRNHPSLHGFGDAYSGLDTLIWDEGDYKDDTLSAMIASPKMNALQSIDTGKRHGYDIKLWHKPRRLNLLKVSAVDLQNIFSAGWFGGVRRLSIEGSHLQNEDMERAFARWAQQGGHELESLTLKKCQISEEFAGLIARHLAPTLHEFRASKMKYQHDAHDMLTLASWSQAKTIQIR